MDKVGHRMSGVRVKANVLAPRVKPARFPTFDVCTWAPTLVGAPRCPLFDQFWVGTKGNREVCFEVRSALEVGVGRTEQDHEGRFVPSFHDLRDLLGRHGARLSGVSARRQGRTTCLSARSTAVRQMMRWSTSPVGASKGVVDLLRH